ncbi:MAG TPA: PAS domain S-box protein [Chryseolinea sp.]|nr:PAS domain S-box protein [Chryseolinea sp.]HPM29618.1 PAS domain S-box protein [Chryseolinea sp.]
MNDIIRHLPAVIYEYTIHPDGTNRFTFISEASEAILGVTPEAVMKEASIMDSLIHEEDFATLAERSNESYKQEGELNWRGRMIIRGEERWMEVRSNHEIDEFGVTIRRGIIQDITERKSSGKESEIRYQGLVERLPMGIAIHIHGKLVFANAHAQLILGAQKSSDIIGTHVMNYIHPDYRENLLERVREVAAGAGVPAPMIEQKFIRVDGKVIDVEAMAFPFIFKGAPSVQVIFRDITERKITEARVKKNETLFSQLFQNIPMAVVMLDESGKVQQINKGFEAMFGYDVSELKGKNLNDTIVPDELRNEGVDLNNLITANQVVRLETIRKHKSGNVLSVILYGMPVVLGKQTIGIYGVYVDITDRKKVEEELKVRNTELDNFVYKVSHDLRAPLSSILGLVNLAKLPGNTDNPMDYIDIIGDKVEHLDHFIGDVLSHSKNLKMEVSISNVNFAQIIDRTFSELSYLEGANEIIRNIKIEGSDFYNDPWRISEILRNLISNSIKYRSFDSKTSEISIKIITDNVRTEISFADNGIGIDEASLNKIFEMFYRATEQSDGSGIGLYIVKNAVDKLGGQITVASKLGEGTRFNIILPNRIQSVVSKISSFVIEPR